eukprot:3472667-Alexandrium_andersonii.AAC.1
MARNGRNALSKLVWPIEQGSGLDARLRQQARTIRRTRQLSAKQDLESKVHKQQSIFCDLARQVQEWNV